MKTNTTLVTVAMSVAMRTANGKSMALSLLLAALALAALLSSAHSNAIGLSAYYTYYRLPEYSAPPGPLVPGFPPEVHVVGGGVDPALVTTSAGAFAVVDRMVSVFGATGLSISSTDVSFLGPQFGPCMIDAIRIPLSPSSGDVVSARSRFDERAPTSEPLPRDGCEYRYQLLPPSKWNFDERYVFQAPTRRKSSDGSQYDASPMVITRNGVPWMTYYWGYRLGLVASASNWLDSNLASVPELSNWPTLPNVRNNFELAKLPPPFVEGDVVEYVNKRDFPTQPGGQYFYAAAVADRVALDAIPAWERTGRSFKSGGYVSVCRFYGGLNGGPNTHFYSADDQECEQLKQIPLLSYEGQTFAVNVPLPVPAISGTKPCPISSKALYRVYNNASASNGRYVSNHRYLTERADVNAAVADGWLDEGQVMCVPQ